ncbi:MAG: PH domain-containing protein, partial [Candidatus Thorarchaeota archaeon]
MTEGDTRVIKPPSDEFESGRIFRPLPSLRHKKWLKFILAAFAFYGVFLFAFFGPPIVTVFVIEFIPLNLYLPLDSWIVGSQVYWIITPIWLIPALVWVHLYVRSIEYSVVGWRGETMPEIYQKKGIITITKKHVPFKNITHVKNRVGIFDRLYGIGCVKVETAGERTGMQATGVLTLIISRLFSSSSEENI